MKLNFTNLIKEDLTPYVGLKLRLYTKGDKTRSGFIGVFVGSEIIKQKYSERKLVLYYLTPSGEKLSLPLLKSKPTIKVTFS